MNQLKIKAIELRRKGYSYSMINERLGVSKSTLSNWLGAIEFSPNRKVIEKIGQAKLKSALSKNKTKLSDIERRKKEGVEEIGTLSKRDLFMLGIGLYLGEGSKSLEEVRIVNCDPDILKLAMKWLRDRFNLKLENFKVTLHDYPDNDVENNKRFWSRKLGLPLKQFTNSILDKRVDKLVINKRKLPYGTAHLYVKKGNTDLVGVRSSHRKIMGWIDAVIKQI